MPIGGSNRGIAVPLNPVLALTLRASWTKSRMGGGELKGKIEVNGSIQSAAQNPDHCLSPISSRQIHEPVCTPSPSTWVPTLMSKHTENEGANGGKGSSVFFFTPNLGATFLPRAPASQQANVG